MDANKYYEMALSHSREMERAMGRCIVARLEAGQEIASLFINGIEPRTNRNAGALILLSGVSHQRLFSGYALLDRLAVLGATAWADGGTLAKATAAAAALIPPDLLAEVRANKAELLALIALLTAPVAPKVSSAMQGVAHRPRNEVLPEWYY